MLKRFLLFVFIGLLFSCNNNDPIASDRPKTDVEMAKQNNYFQELNAKTGITAEQMETLATIWRKFEAQRTTELATPTERIDEKIRLINELQRVESIEAVGEELYVQKIRFDSLRNTGL